MFNVRSLIGWVVSALLIFWLASALDWSAVQAHLKDIALPVFIPLTLVLSVQCLARAWLWAYLLPEGRQVRFVELFDAMMM